MCSFTDLLKERNPERQTKVELCFGTLAQRGKVSHKAILTALKLVPIKCLKVYDINLRQNYYSIDLIKESLENSNVFKINDEELEVFKQLFGLKGEEVEVCLNIMDTYSISYLALTKGDKGSYLFGKEEISFVDTPVVEVEDTIGAGDSFTSTMVMGILNQLPLRAIHEKAVQVSALR